MDLMLKSLETPCLDERMKQEHVDKSNFSKHSEASRMGSILCIQDCKRYETEKTGEFQSHS